MNNTISSTTQTIESWVNSHGDELLSWAYYKTSSREVAEDLVQETFLSATKGIDSFKGNSEPKTWLMSILNNKIAAHYKQKFKKRDAGEVDLDADFFNEKGGWKEENKPANWGVSDEHLLDNDDFNSMLEQCMQGLPESWSAALRMKYLSEKKGSDICQDLEISETNYWQILHRAKVQLRACLEKNWFKKSN